MYFFFCFKAGGNSNILASDLSFLLAQLVSNNLEANVTFPLIVSKVTVDVATSIPSPRASRRLLSGRPLTPVAYSKTSLVPCSVVWTILLWMTKLTGLRAFGCRAG